MTHWEIRHEAAQLIRAMASLRADRYIAEALLPNLARAGRTDEITISSVRNSLESPYQCLEILYTLYAFSRRGKDRHELAGIALEALREHSSEQSFESLLKEPDASSLWATFTEVCRRRGRKPMEQLNRGVVAGLAELSQEIYKLGGTGSIASWIYDGVMNSDRIEPQFMRMVDIRGVGPKLCSLFLRDVVFVFNLEDHIDHVDRLYVQPIDKWLRLIAPYVIEELEDAEAADWVLAGKLAKYARRAGVSGVRFNMGVSYCGSREVGTPHAFIEAVEAITRGRDTVFR